MYIANQMKLKIFMDNEKVIQQGDNDKPLYIIMIGKVSVFLKNPLKQTALEFIQKNLLS